MVGQRQGLRLHHHRWAGAGCAHSESKEPPSRLAHAGFPAAAAGQPGHKPAQRCCVCAAEWDVEPPLCRARQVFVHHRNIHASGFRSLAEGEPVEFVMGTEQKTGKVAAPSAPAQRSLRLMTGARRSPAPDRSIQGHRARRRLCTRWPAAEDRPTGSRPLRRILITSRMPTPTRTLGTASASGVAAQTARHRRSHIPIH